MRLRGAGLGLLCYVLIASIGCGSDVTGEEECSSWVCINMPVGTYGAIVQGKPSGAPNVMFPTSTVLPDGRVLVAGGFTKVTEEAGRFEIGPPSNRAYIYDPETADIIQIGNEMNKARAAHAAIYLPSAKLVLLVGGAELMYMENENTCFPFYLLTDTAGTVGFTYELFDTNTDRFLDWEKEEWPDVGHNLNKIARRVFPGVSLNSDGTVLVTGGGSWPSCVTEMETDADYLTAELYRAHGESQVGGFVDAGAELTVNTMRSVHSSIAVEEEEGEPRVLLVGGDFDGVVDVYSAGEGEFGSFSQVSVDDSLLRAPFFHQMVALGNSRWLMSGGLDWNGNALAAPTGESLHVAEWSAETLTATPVAGDWSARYFHTAIAHDNGWVTLAGGFPAAGAPTALSDVAFFDPAANLLSAPAQEEVPALAGSASALLPNDCILMVGGVEDPTTGLDMGSDFVSLKVGVYCPSHLCPGEQFPDLCE